jgi:DNA-binding winged helix-turn-helix (wHTH) protein
MARVWPKMFVEPANLTVHVAALRRVLGDVMLPSPSQPRNCSA